MNSVLTQVCPTCGRHLQIRREHAGQELICQHCFGPILARRVEDTPCGPVDWRGEVVKRADELLARVATVTEFASAG